MLSILIPTRDYTCYPLVADLHAQAEGLGIPYEILVAEDGSRSQVDIIANHKMMELSHCRHLIRKENVGRAEIRNVLAWEAQYDWILFIDSDALVDSPSFLRTYLHHTGKADVVVGGLKHPTENHDPEKSLRFKYEKAADRHRSAKERSLHPYSQFSPFNFMIRRTTFLDVLFDKACKAYGYEDALFGVELEKRAISILHIDNPLTHGHLDTNQDFLHKTETALKTLKQLGHRMEGHSHLGKTYHCIRRLHLTQPALLTFRLFRPLLIRNLLSAHPSLLLFSFYKLGLYATLKKEQR